MKRLGKSLTDIIYKYKNTEFSWEEFDCCLFTFSVIKEYTNRDIPYMNEPDNYTDYKGAMKTLKKLGCKDLVDLPTLVLNTPKKDISEVKLGEPVYYVNEDNTGILGVCNGVRAYFLQYGGGLTTRPIEDCKYSWSIE